MADSHGPVVRVPIIEEAVTIDKVAVQSDAVRISTVIEKRDVTVNEMVLSEAFQIRRVPMDLPVDGPPAQREEGTTTIISLVEERLVVEKRLFVIEEIHVTRQQTQQRVAVPVTLHNTRATIERPGDTSTTGSTTDD